MFGKVQLTIETYKVEVVTADYFFNARMQPLGNFVTYLNDRRWQYLRLDEAELFPLAVDRQLRGLKRDMVSLTKRYVNFVSVIEEEEGKRVQILQSHRPVIMYLDKFVIQGNLHVNADAKNDDLMEETRDFFAVTEAVVFPIRPVASIPTRKVPLLFISRPQIQLYHAHTQ